MTFVYSALRGYSVPGDLQEKTAVYTDVQALANRFRQCHGSIVCKELLGLDRPEGTPRPEARTPEYYRKRPCPELARSAADILEQFLNEKVPPCDWKAP